MIYKKPVLFTSSLNALQTIQCCNTTSSTSCRNKRSATQTQRRTYAQVANEQAFHDEHRWPEPRHPYRTPTPYQIFDIKKDETYSKSRFYSLAKLYHPDRSQHDHLCPHSIRSVPRETRVERYRLIIAANALLSDPDRRREYDRFGNGWGTTTEPWTSGSRGFDKPAWKPGEDPMCNATWEDWEKWHNRHNPDAQQGQTMSNFTFLSIIITFALLGSWGQYTRSDNFSTSIMVQRDQQHIQASEALKEARQKTIGGGDHKERIQSFVRLREATLNQDESYRKFLEKQETCGGIGDSQS